ncbi:LPXTG cell wall anchor domain-containing protein [Helicobacter salomonis]|uniref:LPXTG cell wall anchor domain-containing protein n=1 Tax=Helicobacter salomonis TaxID=56878 RepID=UPI000CF0FC4C|nr:LPXTG cell wall anchor domain-containing protein [Helicobacter salomonis]
MVENADNTVWIVLAALVMLIGLGALLWFKKKFSTDHLKPIEQEVLSMKEVLTFFKEPQVSALLQENQDLVLVALRQKHHDGRIRIVLTLYNHEKESISNFPGSRFYLVKRIDEDLKATFGGKEMVILK